MSSTKTNSSSGSSTNTFTRAPGASSPDIDNLRNTQFQIDPSIQYRAASARNRVNAGLNNPLGGYSTPQIADARRSAAYRDIDEQASMAGRAGQFDVNNLNLGKSQFLAGLTAPPLVNSGSSYTGQQQFKTPFSSKILPMLQSGASAAAAAL